MRYNFQEVVATLRATMDLVHRKQLLTIETMAVLDQAAEKITAIAYAPLREQLEDFYAFEIVKIQFEVVDAIERDDPTTMRPLNASEEKRWRDLLTRMRDIDTEIEEQVKFFFWSLARAGNLDEISKMVATGLNIEACAQSQTALGEAIFWANKLPSKERLTAVRTLIGAGAKVGRDQVESAENKEVFDLLRAAHLRRSAHVVEMPKHDSRPRPMK